MKTLLLVLTLVPSLALGQEKTAPPSGNPMAGWVPPKVKSEAKDKQEIQALFRAMETASRNGDLDAAAALVDFPVTMITDDSRGEAKGEVWSREQWTQVMKPFYDKPMKDVKVTHKPTIFLLSDSLGSVNDVATFSHGGKPVTTRSSMLVVRRDGTWRVKTMAEGGWGDMTGAPPTASGDQGNAGSASGSAGSMGEPPASSKGQGAEEPKEPSPGDTK